VESPVTTSSLGRACLETVETWLCPVYLILRTATSMWALHHSQVCSWIWHALCCLLGIASVGGKEPENYTPFPGRWDAMTVRTTSVMHATDNSRFYPRSRNAFGGKACSIGQCLPSAYFVVQWAVRGNEGKTRVTLNRDRHLEGG
jgi:hypothetical protein